eukprot:364372-Chlamydomonas_euryale.AAC.11
MNLTLEPDLEATHASAGCRQQPNGGRAREHACRHPNPARSNGLCVAAAASGARNHATCYRGGDVGLCSQLGGDARQRRRHGGGGGSPAICEPRHRTERHPVCASVRSFPTEGGMSCRRRRRCAVARRQQKATQRRCVNAAGDSVAPTHSKAAARARPRRANSADSGRRRTAVVRQRCRWWHRADAFESSTMSSAEARQRSRHLLAADGGGVSTLPMLASLGRIQKQRHEPSCGAPTQPTSVGGGRRRCVNAADVGVAPTHS